MTEAFAPLASVTVDGGDPLVVVVVGEIDQSNDAELWRQLEPLLAQCPTPCLDLGGVTFIGSTGLSLLLRLKAVLEADGRPLQIVAASRPVRRVADVAGLTGTLGLSGVS